MSGVDPLGDPRHAYVQIADVIAARIASGRYHGQLPGERDLAREFGVAYQTQRHAMQLLRTRGLIITRQGRGTFTTLRSHS